MYLIDFSLDSVDDEASEPSSSSSSPESLELSESEIIISSLNGSQT